MDENNNYEQTNSMEEQSHPAAEMTDDALKEVIKTQLEKVRMAALLNGLNAICGVVLQYITEFQKQPGKKSVNDYKRLIKKISNFCSVSLNKTVDDDGNIVDVKKEEE
jgi:hypothetical protein